MMSFCLYNLAGNVSRPKLNIEETFKQYVYFIVNDLLIRDDRLISPQEHELLT